MSRHKKTVQKLDHDTAVYLAGLIDGEGTFFISRSKKQKKSSNYCYTPQFKLTLTHEGIIKQLADKLGKTYTHIKGNPSKNHKDTYCLRVGNFEGIIGLIEQVLPYMVVKHDVAEVMLAFCISRRDNWPSNNYERGYSEQELELYSVVRQLNQVGIIDKLKGILYV